MDARSSTADVRTRMGGSSILHLKKTRGDFYFLFSSLSTEYLPLPNTKSTMKINRNNNGFSFVENGSFACAWNAATPIAMIRGSDARRVPNPRIISIEQITSAKTTSTREIAGPKPKGSANFISSPEVSLLSLGSPCVNMNAPVAIRTTRRHK